MYNVNITADGARARVAELIEKEKMMSSDEYQGYVDNVLETIERKIFDSVELRQDHIIYMCSPYDHLHFDVIRAEVKNQLEPKGFAVSESAMTDTLYISWSW